MVAPVKKMTTTPPTPALDQDQGSQPTNHKAVANAADSRNAPPITIRSAPVYVPSANARDARRGANVKTHLYY